MIQSFYKRHVIFLNANTTLVFLLTAFAFVTGRRLYRNRWKTNDKSGQIKNKNKWAL